MDMLFKTEELPNSKLKIGKKHTKKVPKDFFTLVQIACLVVHFSANQMHIILEKKNETKLKKVKTHVKMGP